MAASEAVALLEALRAQAAEVAAHGREMLRRVRGGQLDTKEVRAQAMLGYLQDLALLACSKSRGISLKNAGGALDRLLETRVVLEKLRPLEQRLKYHLEKLLRAAASGGRGAEDPLSFRPAPSNMAVQEEEEDDDEGEGGGAKAPGLGGGRRYVPPRLVPTAPALPEAESRRDQRARRRALSSAVIRELREELGEGPAQEGAGPTPTSRDEIHRRHFEESMLQRLSAPRRRPRGAGLHLDDVTNFGAFPALLGAANQVRGGRGFRGEMAGLHLDDVTNFGAFPALLGAANQDSSEPLQKKRKKPKTGKKKGKKVFCRRR